jgi:hypothetical protein
MESASINLSIEVKMPDPIERTPDPTDLRVKPAIPPAPQIFVKNDIVRIELCGDACSGSSPHLWANYNERSFTPSPQSIKTTLQKGYSGSDRNGNLVLRFHVAIKDKRQKMINFIMVIRFLEMHDQDRGDPTIWIDKTFYNLKGQRVKIIEGEEGSSGTLSSSQTIDLSTYNEIISGRHRQALKILSRKQRDLFVP